MAKLSGKEIIRQNELGTIFISDFDDTRVGPNSYDLSLSDEFMEYVLPSNNNGIYNDILYQNISMSRDDKDIVLNSMDTGDITTIIPKGNAKECCRWNEETNEYDTDIYHDFLDMKKDNQAVKYNISEDGFILYPGRFYLARTKERTVTNGFVPCIEGRSSIARLGITVHITAGFGDNGCDGYWTLEMKVEHPIKIYPGTRICQIYYDTIDGDASIVYEGKYAGNDSVQSSRLYKDFE
jgi:dCTP deaminase